MYGAWAKIIELGILVRARVKNIEFAQKKLRGLMGYWVGLNIKNIKIPIELGRVPGLAGWWLRPWAR